MRTYFELRHAADRDGLYGSTYVIPTAGRGIPTDDPEQLCNDCENYGEFEQEIRAMIADLRRVKKEGALHFSSLYKKRKGLL